MKESAHILSEKCSARESENRGRRSLGSRWQAQNEVSNRCASRFGDPAGIWYARSWMRRGIHIAISLLAVFLLIKQFDCFSGNKFTKEAADCCRKGKCTPSKGDDCCKGTLPGGKQLLASKAQHSPNLNITLLPVSTPVLQEPTFSSVTFDRVHAPPGSPPSSRLNLPLLI